MKVFFTRATLLSFLILFGSPVRVQAGSYTIYGWQNHDLNVSASSPPAIIFLRDGQGDISGADPTKGISVDGQGVVLQNIPGSFVDQTNIGLNILNNKSGSSPCTNWEINVPDHLKENYVLNLVGVKSGVSEVGIYALYALQLKIPQIGIGLDILVNKGVTKQINILFDPDSKSLTAAPKINPGDLSNDTQSACGLGDIAPASACEALEAFATAAQKAIANNETDLEKIDLEIYLSILNRLHFWGKDGHRHDWDDFKDHSECDDLRKEDLGGKFFAKDPSYSALKLDVDTLLSGLPKDHDK